MGLIFLDSVYRLPCFYLLIYPIQCIYFLKGLLMRNKSSITKLPSKSSVYCWGKKTEKNTFIVFFQTELLPTSIAQGPSNFTHVKERSI